MVRQFSKIHFWISCMILAAWLRLSTCRNIPVLLVTLPSSRITAGIRTSNSLRYSRQTSCQMCWIPSELNIFFCTHLTTEFASDMKCPEKGKREFCFSRMPTGQKWESSPHLLLTGVVRTGRIERWKNAGDERRSIYSTGRFFLFIHQQKDLLIWVEFILPGVSATLGAAMPDVRHGPLALCHTAEVHRPYLRQCRYYVIPKHTQKRTHQSHLWLQGHHGHHISIHMRC